MLTRRRRTHNFFTSPDRDTTLYKVDAWADAAAEAPIRFRRQCHRWAHHVDGLMQPRLSHRGATHVDGLMQPRPRPQASVAMALPLNKRSVQGVLHQGD